MEKMNYLTTFQKAVEWMEKSIVPEKGIIVNSKENVCYPEVTGYFIPTLIEWGYKKEAIQFAKWLLKIQKPDGSWYDCHDSAPYVFDSAQILKGLIAVRTIYPYVDDAIVKGCEWILGNMQEDGRLKTPNNDAWGDEKFCSELVHIYCLSPLRQAAGIFKRKDFDEKADKILNFYKTNWKDRILNFNMLSHFYAYVIEGLVDIGEISMARRAMENIAKIQRENGMIPGMNDIQWTCSTGLFQLALVWFKLGDVEHGNKTFAYACSLQNKSGGWYGSYPTNYRQHFYRDRRKPYYFAKAEISWVVKYFLDALTWKCRAEFEVLSDIFTDQIDSDDGRLELIKSIIKKENRTKHNLRILDAGCGKGRYLLELQKVIPSNKYYAMDISDRVMRDLPENIERARGTLTNIPFEDGIFDIVFACESLEHAIHFTNSLKELMRIIKTDGKVVIIDKNKSANKVKRWKIENFEQWFSDKEFKRFADEYGCKIDIIQNVPYENEADGLFNAWILSK